VVAPGAYTVTVGGAQPGGETPTASASLQIEGTAPLAE
jgi:hypothetical protein